MSVDRWLILLTDEEFEAAKRHNAYGEGWFHSSVTHEKCFDFGDYKDSDQDGSSLKDRLDRICDQPAVDNIAELKELHELSSSTEKWEKIENFIRNGDGKKIHFWAE